MLPNKNSEYLSQQYWEERYKGSTDSFDWFKTFDELKPALENVLPGKNASILILGCGDSTLTYDLYQHGWKNIWSVDYSQLVIDKMSKKYENLKELTWDVMDIRDLSYPDASFRLAIDKGTMDALLTGETSVWETSDIATKNIKAYMSQVHRVLNENGVFVYITFGQPHFRLKFLEAEGWKVTIKTVGDGFHYYIYIVERS